ncbi:MAG: hypothetical protein HUK24_01745, partial [Sphaerochaetaceae bacterium]|nr:hypothetical protein [Sphaerochaetaceae bacterium]
YMSEDGHINPMWLNPSTIYHGYYIRFNSNSTLAFEADYTPIKGLNIYGAFIVDEFAAPGEPVPGKANAAFPNAYGRILGVKAAYALGNGIIYGSSEYVHTDPYLYLRYGQTDSMAQSEQNQKKYGLDYVVAIRNYGNEYGISYDEYFLGYTYGGDLKALNFNLGYRFNSQLSVETNVFYMMHGTHDKWTAWNGVGTDSGLNSADSTKAPTTKHESYNKADSDVSDRNSIENTLVAGINVSYDITESLSTFVQFDFVNITNSSNVAGVNKSDIQIATGIGYSF